MAIKQADNRDIFEKFHAFVDEVLGGLGERSLEEAIVEFRAFQADRDRVLAKLRFARQESQRGQSRELDDVSFWQRINERLNHEGVPQ